ncbi:MAG: hypothetical protein EXS51_02220 [Candidatus Taylorbacteria bacterium]|nr:hypothetical protein [Candidatus Taylorbacteria bacterium]
MTSSVLQLPFSYLLWHYTTAWSDIMRLYRNIAWFLWNFFSVRLLLGTLLSPWHRLHEGSKKSAGGFLGNFIINLLLRFIGFFARLFVILTGLVSVILLSVFFIFFSVIWPFMPLLVVVSTVNGAVGLFSF